MEKILNSQSQGVTHTYAVYLGKKCSSKMNKKSLPAALMRSSNHLRVKEWVVIFWSKYLSEAILRVSYKIAIQCQNLPSHECHCLELEKFLRQTRKNLELSIFWRRNLLVKGRKKCQDCIQPFQCQLKIFWVKFHSYLLC